MGGAAAVAARSLTRAAQSSALLDPSVAYIHRTAAGSSQRVYDGMCCLVQGIFDHLWVYFVDVLSDQSVITPR